MKTCAVEGAGLDRAQKQIHSVMYSGTCKITLEHVSFMPFSHADGHEGGGVWGGVHARLHVGMFSTIMRERSEFNSPLERQRDRFPTRFFSSSFF